MENVNYNKAIGKLQGVGVAEEFLSAIGENPELLKAIKKIAPGSGIETRPGWSCCITVSRPM